MPPTGASVGGVLRLAPFGRAGRAAGKDDDRRVLAGLGRGVFAAALDQIGQRLVVATRGLVRVGVGAQRAQLAQLGVRLADGLGVFVVVDDHLGALALRHLFDLRAGEFAVQQDDAGPRAGGAVVGDEKPATVACQDRHTVAAAHALLPQPVGHRMGGLVEFPVGEFAVFVDARRAVRMASRVERRQHPELAPLVDVGRHPGDVLRRLQPERAGFEDFAHVVQFGRAAFDVLLKLVDSLARQSDEVSHNFTLCDQL